MVHARGRDFEMKWDRNKGHSTFIMIGDTIGEILDVRTDIIQSKGMTLILDAASNKNHFSVTGYYLAKQVGIIWDEQEKAWTKTETQTDIKVNISDKNGMPFQNHRYSGGIFIYQFEQPYLKNVARDSLLMTAQQVDPLDSSSSSIHQRPIPSLTIEPIVSSIAQDSISSAISGPTASVFSLDLNIYPNPTRNILNIRVKGISDFCEIQIHNLSGQLIFSKVIHTSNDLLELSYDVATWSADTYILKIYTGHNKTALKRWVKLG